ncbi:MAG: TolC family protein [Bacteroidetes bacterium]|nr:TolC family protein [Bacteroidota bacterium]
MKKLVLITGWLLTGMAGMAQDPVKPAMDLKGCLAAALENHYKIKTADLERRRSESQLDQVEAAFFPQVTAGTTYQDYIKLPTQLIPGEFFGQPGEMIPIQFGTQYNLNASVDVSQVLFNQPLMVTRKMARKVIEMNRLGVEKSREEVIYETSQIYFATQGLLHQSATLKTNIEKLQRLVTLMQEQYDKGYVRKVDLDRVKVNISNLQSQNNNVEDACLQQLALLKFMMGLPQSSLLVLKDEIEAPVPLGELRLVPEQHLDYQQILKQEELADLKIKEARAGYFPTLTAIGQYSLSSQQNSFNTLYEKPGWLKMSFIGVNLSLPIFKGFGNHYKMNAAKVEKQQAGIQKENLASFLEVQYLNASGKLEVNRKAYENQQKNVQLAEEVYQVTLEQYKKGISPLTEILDAETALSAAQTNLLQAQVQIKLMELDLYKSTGKLTVLMN